MMTRCILSLFCLLGAALPALEPTTPLPPKPQIKEKPANYTFNIVLEPRYMTIVFAEVTTPVLKIHKWMGEPFTEGEVLMELDKRVYEGIHAKASAAVVKYKTELEAKKRLFEDDALSQFELDDTVASLAGAEADLILAKKSLDDATIRAPYNGKVVKINVKEYELAMQGRELITLVNDDFLFAKFLVPSSLMQCLKVGAPIDIRIKENGAKVVAAISRIAPVIDPSSSTIMVEAKIDNSAKALWSGMTGWVTVENCAKK